ncbi:MAG TPA: hypothetical protein VME69_06515 [Methylocella sp.]|nr:hypothetical protein [Methylocella sp.]
MKIISPDEWTEDRLADWQAMPPKLKAWIEIDCALFLMLLVIATKPDWMDW